MNSLKSKAFHYARKSSVAFILFFVVLRTLLAVIFLYLPEYFKQEPLTGFQFDNLLEELILVICIAPITEAFLFQYLPFRFLSKYWHARYIIIVSSLLFASMHFYSPLYFVNGFFAGLIYSTAFYLRQQSHPLLFTTLIHATYNLIVSIQNI